MQPYFTLFGHTFSSYNTMAMIGVISVFIYTAIRCKKTKTSYNDEMYYLAFSFGFSFLGATGLYQLLTINRLIKLLPYLFTDFKYFTSHWSGGLIFYGGLIGIMVGGVVYAKVFRQDSRKLFMISISSVPLFHCFARIGCFLGGCCHGVENHTIGIAYTHSISGEDGIPFIPVQLFESLGNLIIFIIICITTRKNKKYFRPLGLYFTMYGIMRFCLEFLRGDEIRGHVGVLSTSQWISLIVIIPIGIYSLVCPDEKNFFNKWYTSKKIPKRELRKANEQHQE